MSCNRSCQICSKLVISSSITVGADALIVNIPSATYFDGERVCLVIGQSIPDTATINLPVVITIGSDTTQYPLTNCDCVQVTASSLSDRVRYGTKVVTNATSAVFRITSNNVCCVNKLQSIPVVVTTTGG